MAFLLLLFQKPTGFTFAAGVVSESHGESPMKTAKKSQTIDYCFGYILRSCVVLWWQLNLLCICRLASRVFGCPHRDFGNSEP